MRILVRTATSTVVRGNPSLQIETVSHGGSSYMTFLSSRTKGFFCVENIERVVLFTPQERIPK